MPEANNKRRSEKKPRHKRKNPKVSVVPAIDNGPEIFLNVMTNDLNTESFKNKEMLLQMFYQGAYSNSIGYMDALDVEADVIRPVLVGFEPDPISGLYNMYPLAYLITSREELEKLRSPDGKGGYMGHESEVKDDGGNSEDTSGAEAGSHDGVL